MWHLFCNLLHKSYFCKNQLFETAEEFYKYSSQYLFVDDVHEYP